jgi:ribosomal protein L11 methyltransferase
LIRLAVRCRAADAELALAALLDLAPAGVEQVDRPEGRDGVVEYAIYGAPGEVPELGSLQALVGDALVEVRSEPVSSDWNERWKRFYHPLLIGGRLYVRPPWERPAERGGVTEVVIDPGQAFGTGTHATTVMCLELLLDLAPEAGLLGALRRGRRRSLCDLGCGSGVLAIAASKLGFRPVTGVDVERAAVQETDRNARLNGVELELERIDLRAQAVPSADVVTANLTTALFEAVSRSWAKRDTRPATLIASGFLRAEMERVRSALAVAGLSERRLLERGEWAALRADPRVG